MSKNKSLLATIKIKLNLIKQKEIMSTNNGYNFERKKKAISLDSKFTLFFVVKPRRNVLKLVQNLIPSLFKINFKPLQALGSF